MLTLNMTKHQKGIAGIIAPAYLSCEGEQLHTRNGAGYIHRIYKGFIF